MIAALAARRLPFGIASNSRKAFVAGALASLGVNVPVVTCGDEVRRGKPAPDLFWDCANRLGVAVHDRPRTVVFEDSPHGLKAAVAAGMLPIGVTSAVPADELLAAGAVAICMDLGDALNLGWLDQLPGQR
jgi:HAD superfamily hydrolase (TIGR01509 family)